MHRKLFLDLVYNSLRVQSVWPLLLYKEFMYWNFCRSLFFILSLIFRAIQSPIDFMPWTIRHLKANKKLFSVLVSCLIQRAYFSLLKCTVKSKGQKVIDNKCMECALQFRLVLLCNSLAKIQFSANSRAALSLSRSRPTTDSSIHLTDLKWFYNGMQTNGWINGHRPGRIDRYAYYVHWSMFTVLIAVWPTDAYEIRHWVD